MAQRDIVLGWIEQLGDAGGFELRQDLRERPQQRHHGLVHLVARGREVPRRAAPQQPGDEPPELRDPAEDDVALGHAQAP